MLQGWGSLSAPFTPPITVIYLDFCLAKAAVGEPTPIFQCPEF